MVVLGALRTLWLIPIAFAPPGLVGVVVIIGCDTLLLFLAGAFNPLFPAHRMDVVPDHLMAPHLGGLDHLEPRSCGRSRTISLRWIDNRRSADRGNPYRAAYDTYELSL